jgi:hypothetical protein
MKKTPSLERETVGTANTICPLMHLTHNNIIRVISTKPTKTVQAAAMLRSGSVEMGDARQNVADLAVVLGCTTHEGHHLGMASTFKVANGFLHAVEEKATVVTPDLLSGVLGECMQHHDCRALVEDCLGVIFFNDNTVEEFRHCHRNSRNSIIVLINQCRDVILSIL